MIFGHFGNREQPRVAATLLFPRYMSETSIRFLVDTGSDITLIHPPDWQRLGIPTDQLPIGEGTGGVGGQSATWVESAVIRFFDHDGVGRLRLPARRPHRPTYHPQPRLSVSVRYGHPRLLVHRARSHQRPAALHRAPHLVSDAVTRTGLAALSLPPESRADCPLEPGGRRWRR